MLEFASPSSTLSTPPPFTLCRPSSSASNWCWEYFDKYASPPEKKKFVRCRLCTSDDSRDVKYDGSTSKLEQHMERVHGSVYKEYYLNEAKKQRLNETAMSKFVVHVKPTMLSAYIRWIVHTYQPYDTCNDVYFRALCEAIYPGCPVFDRQRITSEVTRVSCRVHDAVASLLKGNQLALTTDHWTSVANESYMALTAHWITSEWKMRSATLCCHHHVLTQETAEEIHRVVREGWMRFDIEDDQIEAILSDTAPNMNAAGQLFHCPHHFCVAHVLELTTKIAFKSTNIEGIDQAMIAARHLVGYFSKSPLQEERLKEIQPENKKVGVLEDVKTRWWSTFRMIERLIRLKPYLAVMVAAHGLPCNLTEQQWKILEVVHDVLQPFMEVQKALEGHKYVCDY